MLYDAYTFHEAGKHIFAIWIMVIFTQATGQGSEIVFRVLEKFFS